MEKYRKTGGPLKCKQCVAEVELKEREAAAAKASLKKQTNSSGSTPPTKCASCQQVLSSASFNRNQLSKGEGKARCRACVEKSVANEEAASQKSKDSKIAAAKDEIEKAKAKGDMAEIVRAESVLAALEAEVCICVTQ